MKKSFLLVMILLLSGFLMNPNDATSAEPEILYSWQELSQNVSVFDIAVGSSHIWGVHPQSVIRWHKEDRTYRTFPFEVEITAIEIALNNQVWVGTQEGLYLFNGSNWVRVSDSSLMVTALSRGPQGELLVGVADPASILIFDGAQWQAFPTQGLQLDPQGCFQFNSIRDMVYDAHGRMWVALSLSTCYFDTQTGVWQLIQEPSFFATQVQDIELHPNGDLWFAGLYTGEGTNYYVARLSHDGQWTRYTNEQIGVFPYAESQAITIAPDGSVWAGFKYMSAVARFDGLSWTVYNSPTSSNSVKVDNMGDIWISGQHLARLTNNNWQTYLNGSPVDPNASPSSMGLLAVVNDTLWLNTVGIFTFDGQLWQHYAPSQVGGTKVTATATDNNGHMWFGVADENPIFGLTGNGVTRFDGTNWQTFTTADGLAHNLVRGMLVDANNNLWLSHPNGGLSQKSNSGWIAHTTAEGLADNNVWAMTLDGEGYIWVTHLDPGLNPGLSRNSSSGWTTYSTADGLVHNSTEAIFFYDGDIWISYQHLREISRFDGTAWTHYDADDDVLPTEGSGAFFVDRQNTLWFRRLDGLSRWDGDTWHREVSGLWHMLAIDSQNHIWLDYAGNTVRFDGSQLHPVSPAQIYPYSALPDESGSTIWFVSGSGKLLKLKILEVNARVFLPIVSQ